MHHTGGLTCAAGDYYVSSPTEACNACPVNSYCLGGTGNAAVSTPCPGTMTTNGATGTPSMLMCAQGRFWQSVSTLPAQDNAMVAQYDETTAASGLRFVASSNGLLLGSVNGGTTWVTTGPQTNRTWVAIATCMFSSLTVGVHTYGVVAADSAGNIFAGANIHNPAALPATWTQLLNQSSNASPVFGASIISIACSGNRNSASVGAFTVLVATSSAVWFGVSNTQNSATIQGTMYWRVQNVPPGGGVVYSGVSASVVGQHPSAWQTAVYAVSYNGGVNYAWRQFSSTVTTGVAMSWSLITPVSWPGGSSPDIVSISLGGWYQASVPSSYARIAVAVRGGHVYEAAATGTGWRQLSTSPGSWSVVKYSTFGGINGRVAALRSDGTLFVTNGVPTSPNTRLVRASTAEPSDAAMVSVGNPLRHQPVCKDVTVSMGPIDTAAPTHCVTGATAAFAGNTIYSAVIDTTNAIASWPAQLNTNALSWRGMAAARTGPIVVAFTASNPTGSDIYVSNSGGQSWRIMHTSATATCTGVACDAECEKIVLICSQTVIFSIDGGDHFAASAATLSAAQTAVAMNKEGTIFYLGDSASRDILLSTDTTTFATFVAKFGMLPPGIGTESIAAGSGNVLVIGTSTTATGTGMYISHDALATAPTMITPTPADVNGPYKSIRISDDNQVVAAYGGGGSQALFIRLCNVVGSSACTDITNSFPSMGGAAVIAMTADGGRITAAGSDATATLIHASTRNGNSYSAPISHGIISVYGALACSGDGGVTLAAMASGFIYQAHG